MENFEEFLKDSEDLFTLWDFLGGFKWKFLDFLKDIS